MLLHKMSTLNVSSYDEFVEHDHEFSEIWDVIELLPNYNCSTVISYHDIIHKDWKNKILGDCPLHDSYEMCEYADTSEGVDYTLGDNNIFTIVCYGKPYELDNKTYYTETHIHIIPYDENYEYIDISGFLINHLNINIRNSNVN